MSLYLRYKNKTLYVLNESVIWNKHKLPNNTLELQLKKINEEQDEVEAAETYSEKIKELGDVLIAIGGVARFDKQFAKELYTRFTTGIDKYLYMDIVDEAEKKLPELWKRTYADGYHH